MKTLAVGLLICLAVFSFLVTVGITLAGDRDKGLDRFLNVTKGMTEAQAVKRLGEPDIRERAVVRGMNADRLEWETDKGIYRAIFVAGRLRQGTYLTPGYTSALQGERAEPN